MMYNLANTYNSFPMFGLGWGFLTFGAILFFILMLALIALKGYALWHAAKRDEKGWFIALLVLNTFGILELVYLYFVIERQKKKESNSDTLNPQS